MLFASTATIVEQWCVSHGLTGPWVVAVVSALPVVELRAAIPVGILGFQMPPWQVFWLALVGNLAVIPVLLLILDPLLQWIRGGRLQWVQRLLSRCENHARKRAGVVERFELCGLILFVGMPVPGTGAWTGAFVATLFRLPRVQAGIAVAIGVIVAGLAVLAGTMGVDWILAGCVPPAACSTS